MPCSSALVVSPSVPLSFEWLPCVYEVDDTLVNVMQRWTTSNPTTPISLSTISMSPPAHPLPTSPGRTTSSRTFAARILPIHLSVSTSVWGRTRGYSQHPPLYSSIYCSHRLSLGTQRCDGQPGPQHPLPRLSPHLDLGSRFGHKC